VQNRSATNSAWRLYARFVTASAAGTVFLVGAGPGDPGLATQRALELIAEADAIVHDRLVSKRLLALARPDAELVYAGKRPGEPTLDQDEINRLLIDFAREGKRVVRLKGGDPFVFGRGGEEAEALAEAGVPFEIVPGVTAGVAAPAYAGIPVTHRDEASAVAFVTAHEDPAKAESALDWAALAAFPGTLVFYMGVRTLPAVVEKLIMHGRAADEPAAVIERGTLPGQRTVTAPLGEIAEKARDEDVKAPAVTIVGSVAGRRERLAWLERAPLYGRTVAVTRARAQASGLASRLAGLGAEVVEAPAIRIVPKIETAAVEEAVKALASGNYEFVCLTSPNGADLLCEALDRAGLDARALAGTTIAAIGPATSEALARRGLRADLVPERSIAESLAAELATRELAGRRILIARAAEARDLLPDSLREAGAEVDVVSLYETIREELDEEEIAAVGRADYVTFTSSSTVRHFLDALGGASRFPASARVVSIGPVTSATARELGLRVDVEAEQHDVDGLVTALTADALDAVGSRI
jgi:uroporphyrinogen III methyltransferase/synthase